jgi:hypothetical protein
VAGVTVDTGPVTHCTPWRELREDRKFLILGAWMQFVHVSVKYDCRELLRIVEEMQANEAWVALGYTDLDDLLRHGIEIDPQLVDWAIEGLHTLDPNEPQPFAKAVEAGKLMTRSEAGKLGGRGKKASRDRGMVSKSDTAEYVLARLRRDDPELAERVERGELTANAAAPLKGWRKKRTPYDDVISGLRRASEEDRARLEEFFAQRAAFAADHAEELRPSVLAGESSPHPTVIVPLDVELAAVRLRRHFAPDDRARPASLLVGEEFLVGEDDQP